MPYDFHNDASAYLQFLRLNAEKSIIPFIKQYSNFNDWSKLQVLELGCGEGGNLAPFADLGCVCTGIDLNLAKIEAGKAIMAKYIEAGTMHLFGDDIFNPAIASRFYQKFDIIILKDVIEHIPNKEQALLQMQSFLTNEGVLFVGWPPWAMPFGGHQQICEHKLLRKLPWIHLLHKRIYKFVLEIFGEPKKVVDELLEIKDFRVPLHSMFKLVKATEFKILGVKHYFINPIYEFKFGLKTREQLKLVTKVPFIRDFVTTSTYLLLSKKNY